MTKKKLDFITMLEIAQYIYSIYNIARIGNSQLTFEQWLRDTIYNKSRQLNKDGDKE